jgi:hypothetical protein
MPSEGVTIAAASFCIGMVFGRARVFQLAVIVCWSVIVLPNVVTWLFAARLTGADGDAAGGLLLLSIFGGLFVVAPLTAGMILRLVLPRHAAP